MTTYRWIRTYVLAVFIAINVTGCGEKHSDGEAHAGHGEHDGHAEHASTTEEHGVEFKEGKGLHVPESASKMLGVKTVEVSEGKVEGKVGLSLRVFSNGQAEGAVLAGGSVSTNEAAKLRQGQTVEVAKTNPKEPATGTISHVQNIANEVGVADVIVRFPKEAGLKPGEFIDATVTVASGEDVALVPNSSLLKTAEGEFVYVVNGQHLFRTQVTTGTEGSEQVEIKEGLYAGDVVVQEPVMPLWLAELQAIRGGKACADGH